MTKETLTNDQRLDYIESLVKLSAISQKRVLTLQEVSWYTGRSLSNLYKLTSSGELPMSKPEGKYIYVDRLELEEWMLRNPVKTNEQTNREAATIVTLTKKRSR
jgi:excisionase family DNA binding protein